MTLEEQFHLAMRNLTQADIDRFSKVLTDPAAITPEENRTTAEKLGIKRGLLAAAVNTFSDPTVWLALWMSKRFPTTSWLRGSIPTRFVGHANEFTGISQFTRPVETYFRGTPVPRLVALAEQRKAEVLKVGERMFAKMDRPNWKEEMPIVSLMLEGQTHPRVTPELRRVAGGIRKDMDELWGLLRQTKHIAGGFEGTEVTRASARDFAPQAAPRYLRDYLPHIPLSGEESVVTVSAKQALHKLGGGKVQKYLQAVGEDPRRVWGIDETGRLAADWTRYQTFLNNTQGQVYNPHLFHRSRMDIPLQSAQGQQLFVTDLNVVLGKYISSVARTYANNAPISDFERVLASTRVRRPDGTEQTILPSNDPIIVQLINYGLDATGARYSQHPVPGTRHTVDTVDPASANPLMLTGLRHLTRAVMGRADEGQITYGNMFSAVGRHFDQSVGYLTNKQRAQVDDAMQSLHRTRQWRGIANGVTSYFYGSTLGMNPWSAMQNLLQPILTTAPAIGVGATLAGYRELGRRLPAYANELRRQHGLMRQKGHGPLHRINEAADRAFSTVFKDLADSGIKPDVRLFDMDPQGLTLGSRGQRAFKNYDAFARFILQPFNHTEMSNQIVTFFGAKQAVRNAMRMGTYDPPRGLDGKPLVGEALEKFLGFEAGNVVTATQFRPSPGGKSIWQGRVPSFARQFTSFPTRALSFFTESTVRGALTEREIETAGMFNRIIGSVTGGRNLGTLARTYLYGRMAVEGGRQVLGVDLENALGITGPFVRGAPPGQIIPGLPAPPIASVAMGIASAAVNRDIKKLQPLIIPGYGEIPWPRTMLPAGVQLGRMGRALQQWRPDLGGFADDDERLMYRGNTTDLVLAMLGLPSEKQRRTRQYIERSHNVRMRVRDFRRQYALARANYDLDGMRSISQQWGQTFPDWPAITVSDRDVQRYRSMARVPVLQRMLKTMGDAGRYLQDEIYEVDPDILAPPEMPMMMLPGAA
jgi:hypothetical protein